VNDCEQAAIRMMQQHCAAGLSLRQIVATLNRAFITTKQEGLWQANTVWSQFRHPVKATSHEMPWLGQPWHDQ